MSNNTPLYVPEEIEEENDNSLQFDAMTVMEQIHMAESRHMQLGALVSYQLQYPDMTIRDFFGMAAADLEEEDDF